MSFAKCMESIKNILTFVFLSLFMISCEYLTPKDITMVEPVALYNADDLIYDLKNDKSFPKEGVISVKGFIKETNTKNGKFNILIQGNSNQTHYIICEMNTSFKSDTLSLSKGDAIAIKGVLKGYLNDVVLLNCVMDNNLQDE